jgi:LacI family transcriptional regulator
VKRKTTIVDIARAARVSPATVSMVLNGKPGVGRSTRAEVLRLARRLHYAPNLVARSLVKRRSKSVALMVSHTRNPIFPEIASGVEGVLRGYGYSLYLISTWDDPEVEAREIQEIKSRGIDGIITSASLVSGPHLGALLDEGYPVVAVLRRPSGLRRLDYVGVDNVKGAAVAVKHLARLGHTRIGVISGPPTTSTGLERLEGALRALRDCGLALAPGLSYKGDFSRECGHDAARRFLGLPPRRRPTAVFAANDSTAMGAFEAVLEAGLRVPEDLAIVGFNNVEATSWKTFEITTVEQHPHEMGRRAAERVVQLIERRPGHDRPCQVLLEPRLVIRKSCGFMEQESNSRSARRG